ncbi:MAG: class I SAM-dependent methyltransferase [Planctomycetes bacterium]|nr:class I SAM-dependent methyltransferase [Planctomycetota bacterium]
MKDDLLDTSMSPGSLTEVLEAIQERQDLPKAFHRLGLRSGVEIGVHRGSFSHALLRSCPTLEQLLSVDLWLTPASPGGCPKRHTGPGHIAAASSRLARFGHRSVMVRADSAATSQLLAVEGQRRKFDFIYIDADHGYEAVKQDLELWWLHLADHPRAIFAGHDYRNRRQCQVKRAVDAFALAVWLRLFVTVKDRFSSWIVCRGVPTLADAAGQIAVDNESSK